MTMFRKFSSFILVGVCGALVATTALVGNESSEKQRAPVGTRAEPFEKQMVRLQEREAKVSKEEKKSAKDQKKSKKASLQTTAKSMRSANASSISAARSVYYTSHPGAYQNPVSISYYGDSVELMDGSIWTIKSSDAYKTINWFPTDLIVITPNNSWFSSYGFRLTNQSTGESVASNLYLGPIDPMYGSIYTHWITAIDPFYNIIYLEDGSVWNMSSLDGNVVDQWVVNDVVIIGVNDGWFSAYNPNILINVNMLNFAAGSAVY